VERHALTMHAALVLVMIRPRRLVGGQSTPALYAT